MGNNNDKIDEWTADIDELEKKILLQESNKYYKLYLLMFILGLLLLPFASYFVHYIIVLAEHYKQSQIEDEEIVKAIASAAFALPFYVSYKIIKPYGKPALKATIVLLLAVMGVLLFLEYLYFIDYFLARRVGEQLAFLSFGKNLLWGLKNKWLFSVPLVVIWIDIIIYSNIIKYVDWLSLFLEIDADEIKYAIYAVIAIVISAVLRILFMLV